MQCSRQRGEVVRVPARGEEPSIVQQDQRHSRTKCLELRPRLRQLLECLTEGDGVDRRRDAGGEKLRSEQRRGVVRHEGRRQRDLQWAESSSISLDEIERHVLQGPARGGAHMDVGDGRQVRQELAVARRAGSAETPEALDDRLGRVGHTSISVQNQCIPWASPASATTSPF